MNTHFAVRVAKTDIQRILAVLALTPGLELDEQLKLSMLEGETELFEVVRSLLDENENDDGQIAALGAQVDARALRIERAKVRIEARKKAIMSLMDSARETTLKLPEATLSLRTLKARPKVADAEQLPDGFYTTVTTRKPDLDAIQTAFESGQPIPGVTITNGGSSLTIRRK